MSSIRLNRPKLFISHSSQDKKDVRRLARDLKGAGVGVWLDEVNIRLGESISERIEKGLKECDYMAIWLTKNSVNSAWVGAEWRSLFHNEIMNRRPILLPIIAENCTIPPLLRDKKYADFRYDYRSGLKTLLEFLVSEESPSISKECIDSVISLEYFNVDSRLCPYVQKIYEESDKESIPLFEIGFGKTYRYRSKFPIFLLTVYNESPRKILLHTIEANIFSIDIGYSRKETGFVKSLGVYDVELPREFGVQRTSMVPQIGIASGDLASFHVRLLSPKGPRGYMLYLMQLRIVGSEGNYAETGRFRLLPF